MPGSRASSHIFSGESTPTGLASSETRVVANWTEVIAVFKCDSSSQLKFIFLTDIISNVVVADCLKVLLHQSPALHSCTPGQKNVAPIWLNEHWSEEVVRD